MKKLAIAALSLLLLAGCGTPSAVSGAREPFKASAFSTFDPSKYQELPSVQAALDARTMPANEGKRFSLKGIITVVRSDASPIRPAKSLTIVGGGQSFHLLQKSRLLTEPDTYFKKFGSGEVGRAYFTLGKLDRNGFLTVQFNAVQRANGEFVRP